MPPGVLAGTHLLCPAIEALRESGEKFPKCGYFRRRCLTVLGESEAGLPCGAVPLDRGRRPRRPARTLQDADPVVPDAGRGRPAQTGGSAPQLPQHCRKWKNEWHWLAKLPRKRVTPPAPQNGSTPHTRLQLV